MFKTGPITRVINSLYRNQQILTFYGIRKSESVSRSKYNRVEDDAESVKIQQQSAKLRHPQALQFHIKRTHPKKVLRKGS